MATTNIIIKGMHCPSCEALIKDVFADEGAQVSTNYKDGKTTISHDEKLSYEKIVKLVEEEGYEVAE